MKNIPDIAKIPKIIIDTIGIRFINNTVKIITSNASTVFNTAFIILFIFILFFLSHPSPLSSFSWIKKARNPCRFKEFRALLAFWSSPEGFPLFFQKNGAKGLTKFAVAFKIFLLLAFN